MFSTVVTHLPGNRAVVLENVTCPYCNAAVTKNSSSKEHVIGRRFVPKGALDGWWNLIVRACTRCNAVKADLEDDISAITMAWLAWHPPANGDETDWEELRRKAEKSISRKTKKPVGQSQEELNVAVPFGPDARLTMNLVCPPQIEESRVFELARLQLMGFFYFITYDKQSRIGYFWPGGFYPLSHAHGGDWGNPLQTGFMNAVVSWEPRFLGTTANGFFRTAIRRHPSAECWSWALEWNKSHRVIGFFGAEQSAQEIVDTLEPLRLAEFRTGETSTLRVRHETQLAEQDDVLFDPPDA